MSEELKGAKEALRPYNRDDSLRKQLKDTQAELDLLLEQQALIPPQLNAVHKAVIARMADISLEIGSYQKMIQAQEKKRLQNAQQLKPWEVAMMKNLHWWDQPASWIVRHLNNLNIPAPDETTIRRHKKRRAK
jgi:hypothetical protein